MNTSTTPAPYCDRERGCICGFKNVVCSNYSGEAVPAPVGELPPLPAPYRFWPKVPVDGYVYTADQMREYALASRAATPPAVPAEGLAELRRALLHDAMDLAQALPDPHAMYAEGWFTGQMNGLDENSPHHAKTLADAVRFYRVAVVEVTKWRLRDGSAVVASPPPLGVPVRMTDEKIRGIAQSSKDDAGVIDLVAFARAVLNTKE